MKNMTATKRIGLPMSSAILLFLATLGCLVPAPGFAQVLLPPPTPPNDKADTQQQVIADRRNSPEQEKKPYVILISADGFRYDLADKYQAPNLLRLREAGVAATSMKPSFPTLTFPNHYSLATGLYPSHHGIVDNAFYDAKKKKAYFIKDRKAVRDGSWYGGTPIWVLAEQQQMLTASFYWVGTEAPIQGIYSTYFYYFARGLVSLDQRVQVVKDWLRLPPEKRPHLITFYFEEVDHAEHYHNVDSKETAEAVRLVDEGVGKLKRMTDSLGLPVSFVFVSDHGMAEEDTVHNLPLPWAVDTTKFLVTDGDVLLHLYAHDKKDILPAYNALKAEAGEANKEEGVDFDVYLPDQTPPGWHYAKQRDDRYDRIGDILLIARFPKVFNLPHRKPLKGMHGWDNELPDLQATFYAWGPAFKQHLRIGVFENVAVYPMIAKILGLEISEKIDGDPVTLKNILR
jgi:predicted AlkP superfamily pyrophosphatase or phosphodiesterase